MAEHKRNLILLTTILLLSVTGVWISGQLVEQHADLWAAGSTGGGLFERVCRAGQAMGLDCATGRRSQWSELVVTLPIPSSDLSFHLHRTIVPVAFLGLAYFVFMAIWFAVVGRPSPGRGPWQRIPAALGILGLVVSLFYSVMMAVGQAPVCVWCVATHAVNLLLVLAIHRLYRHSALSWRKIAGAAPVSPGAKLPDAGSVAGSRLAACACAFALVLTAGLWFHRHEQLAMADRLHALKPYKDWVTSRRQDPAFLLREHGAQPENAIPLRQGEQTGDDRPRLVVFTDYECAACACNAVKIRKQVMPAFNGQLHVAIRHFPLCHRCNPAAGGLDHPNACAAACAVEAARRQGGETAAHRMHDLLFENRRRLGTALYQDLAASIGLDARRFMNDLHDEDVREVIRQDVALAQRLGVDATPTMFLDGRRVTAFGRDNPVFWTAIAREQGAPRGEARVAARP